MLNAGNSVSLSLGIGGVRDVASSSTSHEQTQSNRFCGFQTLVAVFPKNPQFRLFTDQNSCRCAVWQPLNVSPCSVLVCFTFSGPLGLWGPKLRWKLSIAQPRPRRREGCRIFLYLS